MTLSRQLLAGVSLVFLVLLAGIEAIYLANSRAQLQEQLGSSAQEAATSLALRLAALKQLEDRVLVETLVNPVFDRGYFQEIRVVSTGGETLVRKVLAPAQGGVPEWFTALFPLSAPPVQSLVSSGWRELGRVVVVSHPNFAYQQLWRTGTQTLAWLLLVYAAAMAAVMAFVALLLRPLREIERVAVAIGEREFTTVSYAPRARELARVVSAMNSLSTKIARMISDESARAETLRRDAFVDPVTSLYNRRGFEHQLQSLLRSGTDVFSTALALLEFRDFAAFNSQVGYHRGDEVLALFATTITGACAGRASVCGRLTGAGFAFAALNVDADELEDLVATVCRRIGLVFAEQGIGSQLRFDCGATRAEGSLPPFSALLASADHALESARAKGDSEHAVEIFDQSAPAGSQAWRARIERALDEGRLALYAQEVLGLPGRTPIHEEVTVRMIDETGGTVPAAQFLPMAARHGIIGRLDVWVAERLFGYLARHDGSLPLMALNISARSAADADASRRILGLLDARRDLARRVIFEMTEFGVLQDAARAQWFCGEVRRRGAQFAMDNFSTHPDSLMLVHALRPHYIKLAPGYSRELPGSRDCRFFVASIVRIAQPLEIGILAQAVEDEGLIPLLADLGLSGYQGFAASRPAPIGRLIP